MSREEEERLPRALPSPPPLQDPRATAPPLARVVAGAGRREVQGCSGGRGDDTMDGGVCFRLPLFWLTCSRFPSVFSELQGSSSIFL